MREFVNWADREGRLDGDPHWVNRSFFCGDTDNYTDEQVEEFLKIMHDSKKNGVGLIELYKVDNVQYMWMPGFESEQSKSWLHFTKPKEAESSIPPPPDKTRPTRTKPLTDIILTPFETEVLETIKTIPGWEYDEAEDTAWIRSLSEDFANLTIDHIKGCKDYYTDKPETKGPWKNRIRNWLKREKEKPSGKTKQNPRQLRDRKDYTDLDNP